MSGSLSPSWIKPVVLYMLDQKGEYNAKFEKQYLGSKTVQVIRIFKDMCAIEVSDKSSSIVVSVSESCMKYLRTQDSFKNLPALRNAVLQLKTWHISTITQCFSLKDLRRSMDHGMTLPMCIRCDKIELLGGDDCIIFGDPYDINQNKDIKTILSKQINYSTMVQKFVRMQFPNENSLPNGGKWVHISVYFYFVCYICIVCYIYQFIFIFIHYYYRWCIQQTCYDFSNLNPHPSRRSSRTG
mgnify:FL=1